MDEPPDATYDPASPRVTACTRCPALVESRSQIVNGQGHEDARLLLVGEAPGTVEDEAGVPFVGRSGGILNDALRERDLDRATVRITNCVRCRPPDNRNPHVEERRNCRSHLEREVRLVDPTVVLTLGRVPAEELLDRSVRVTAEAGTTETVDLGGAPRTLVIGLHPAATLYDRDKRGPFRAALDRAIDLADLD